MAASPLADMASLAALVDKVGVVVLDVGAAYTKVGFAGERSPRAIAPSVFSLPDGSRLELQSAGAATASEAAWRKALERHLKHLLYGSLGLSGGSASGVAFAKRKAKESSEGNSGDCESATEGSATEVTAIKDRAGGDSMGGDGFSVLVVESLLLPLPFRRALSFVLFERLFAEKVSFWISEAAPLLSLPILPLPKGENLPKERRLLSSRLHASGVVLDVGSAYCRALPVIDGVAFLPALVAVPTAARALHRRLRALLQEHCVLETPLKPHVNPQLPSPAMPSHVLEDVLVRLCFVCLRGYSSDTVPQLLYEEAMPSPLGSQEEEAAKDPASAQAPVKSTTDSPSLKRRSERNIVAEENKRVAAVAYTLADGSVLHVGGYVRAQATAVLFENTEEHPSVSSAVLDTLLACPVDSRLQLAHSLVLSGGVTQMAGFSTRLLEELEELLATPKYAELAKLSGHFDFLGSTVEPRLRPWVGGSVVGSLQEAAAVVTQEKYFSTANCLPEWTQANGATPHARWRR